MCRKFGLKRPIYEPGPKLVMFDLGNERHEVERDFIDKKDAGDSDEDTTSNESEDDEQSTSESSSDESDVDGASRNEASVEESDEAVAMNARGRDHVKNRVKTATKSAKIIRMGPRVDRKLEQLALNALNNWKKYAGVFLK